MGKYSTEIEAHTFHDEIPALESTVNQLLYASFSFMSDLMQYNP